MPYGLRLSDDELARYRMMAQRARDREASLWEQAGLVRGARVADVGCGPGAMTVMLADLVGPHGTVVGVDSDEGAVAAARATLAAAGLPNAEARLGSADDTGLAEGSFDTVVLRHVLAHNGGAEQRIVDHLAWLARPGGHVYLVDVDLGTTSFSPSVPDLEDLLACYLRWHAQQGNDPRVGRRLAALGRAAGLTVETFENWFETVERWAGLRGPPWAAREAMLRSGVACEGDLARWAAAFDKIDTAAERPRFTAAVLAAVCRRPPQTALDSAGTSDRRLAVQLDRTLEADGAARPWGTHRPAGAVQDSRSARRGSGASGDLQPAVLRHGCARQGLEFSRVTSA